VAVANTQKSQWVNRYTRKTSSRWMRNHISASITLITTLGLADQACVFEHLSISETCQASFRLWWKIVCATKQTSVISI